VATIGTVRGNYVVITTTFYDAQGVKAEPIGIPVITFAWPGAPSVALSMSSTDDPAIWTLQWDTSMVDANFVDYSVKAEASPGFYIVDNGTITIASNLANVTD
jgi:hypothetical protein